MTPISFRVRCLHDLDRSLCRLVTQYVLGDSYHGDISSDGFFRFRFAFAIAKVQPSSFITFIHCSDTLYDSGRGFL